VRALGRPVIGFSQEMQAHDKALKAFLYERMYRHYKVNRMTHKVKGVVRALFGHYLAEPACLPEEWRREADAPGSAETARLVADYIAGMTDRFAMDEHRKLFDVYAKT
jgi:dGTPase